MLPPSNTCANRFTSLVRISTSDRRLHAHHHEHLVNVRYRTALRVNPREKVTETSLAHSVRNVTRQGSCAVGHDELLISLHGRLSSGLYGWWTTRSCRVRCRLSPFGLPCGQCLGCPLAHMVWQCRVRRSCGRRQATSIREARALQLAARRGQSGSSATGTVGGYHRRTTRVRLGML